MRAYRAPIAALAVLLLGVLAGCGDSKSGEKISVTSTDTECQVAKTALTAGRYTFSVTNKGSNVTEFYVFKGGKVEGEVEDISPNVTRDLNIELAAGEYEGACKPGMKGDGIRVKITVSGQAAASAAEAAPAAGVTPAAPRRWWGAAAG
jgi:iron uptake system component EfeO